nr:MAG TPA: hypothetical protein [Caudoviricetes sp.]
MHQAEFLSQTSQPHFRPWLFRKLSKPLLITGLKSVYYYTRSSLANQLRQYILPSRLHIQGYADSPLV